MDLNQLLKHHQIALINAGGDRSAWPADDAAPGSRYDMVRHYERRITDLRRSMGVRQYPGWTRPAPGRTQSQRPNQTQEPLA